MSGSNDLKLCSAACCLKEPSFPFLSNGDITHDGDWLSDDEDDVPTLLLMIELIHALLLGSWNGNPEILSHFGYFTETYQNSLHFQFKLAHYNIFLILKEKILFEAFFPPPNSFLAWRNSLYQKPCKWLTIKRGKGGTVTLFFHIQNSQNLQFPSSL